MARYPMVVEIQSTGELARRLWSGEAFDLKRAIRPVGVTAIPNHGEPIIIVLCDDQLPFMVNIEP